MTTPILKITEAANGQVDQYLTYNEALRALESSTNNFYVVDMSAGNVTLTDSANVDPALNYIFSRNQVFRTTGNTVSRVLTVPQTKRLFVVQNGGDFAVTVKRGTTEISLNAALSAIFYSDGTADGLSAVSTGSGGGGGGTGIVESVADLRAVEDVVDGQTIATLGHSVRGLGAGQFYFDEADVTTPDNNGTVIVTGDGKRFKRKLSVVFDVRMFGAKGDGVSDDTAAVQAALNTAGSMGYGVVIPGGEFVVGALTSSGCKHISGYGETSVIKAQGAVDTLTLTTDGVTVDGVKFLGTGVAYQIAIRNSGKFKCAVRDCIFENFDEGGSGGVFVDGVGTSRYGLLDGMKISDCQFYRCNHGVDVGLNGEYVTISDCIFQEQCGWPVWSIAGNTIITGGNISKCMNGIYKSGIDGEGNPSNGNHSIISGININHIFTDNGGGSYTTGHALWFDNVTLGEIVTGCAIYDAHVTLVSSTGIQINSCMLAVTDYNFHDSVGSIENCQLYKAYGHNINNNYLGGTPSFVQWSDNRDNSGNHGALTESIRGGKVLGTITGGQSVASGSGETQVLVDATVVSANNAGAQRFPWWDPTSKMAQNLGYGGNRLTIDVQFFVEFSSGGSISETLGFLYVGSRAYTMNRIDYAGNACYYNFVGDIVSSPGETVFLSFANNSGETAVVTSTNGRFIVEGL